MNLFLNFINGIFINPILKAVDFLFRLIEYTLCIRKHIYKPRRRRRVNVVCDYYYNKEKFKQMYA